MYTSRRRLPSWRIHSSTSKQGILKASMERKTPMLPECWNNYSVHATAVYVTSGKICCSDEFTYNINYTSLPYKKIRRTTAALVTLILYIAHANTRTGKMWIQTLWILNSHISFKNTRQPAYSRRKTHLTALHYITSPSTASACISSA